MSCIPVIDFSLACSSTVGNDLMHAMETVGFVYLDNVPGFDKQREQQLYQEANWFFSLPLEEKLLVSSKKWNKHSSNVYRGYVPINVEEGHLREQYEMGGDLPADDADRCSGNPLYEATTWPRGERGEAFHELMIKHYDAMHDAGMKFLQLLALGLGLDENHFAHKFSPKPTSSLRIMHYPTYRKTGEQRLTCEEHFDANFVTLLATCSYEGLEVLMEDGVWTAVEPRPGSLVVNIGDLLSHLTGRRLKATQHRVQDIGRDRYSVPFFFEPQYNSKFEFPLDSKTITYGPWILKAAQRHKYQYGHLADYPKQEHIEPTEWARERVTPYTRNTTAKSKHGDRLTWETIAFLLSTAARACCFLGIAILQHVRRSEATTRRVIENRDYILGVVDEFFSPYLDR